MAGSQTVSNQRFISNFVGYESLVAGLGFEPRLSASEAPVLPLYDPALLKNESLINTRIIANLTINGELRYGF